MMIKNMLMNELYVLFTKDIYSWMNWINKLQTKLYKSSKDVMNIGVFWYHLG
jgi:hypothetical protein